MKTLIPASVLRNQCLDKTCIFHCPEKNQCWDKGELYNIELINM